MENISKQVASVIDQIEYGSITKNDLVSSLESIKMEIEEMGI